MTTWTNATSCYAARESLLRDTRVGSSNQFKLNAQTVIDDNSVDSLQG